MDELPAEAITGFVLVGLIIAVLGIWSLRFYFRKYRQVTGGRGRYDVGYYRLQDLIISLLIIGWFLITTLPVYFIEEASASVINIEAIGLSVAIYLVLILMLAGFLALRGANLAELFGFNKLPAGKSLLAAAGFLLAAYPLLALAGGIGQVVAGEGQEVQGIVQFFVSNENTGERMLVIFMAVVVAPVVEEFIFRGYFYGTLKARIGMLPAMLLSGLVFSVVHAHVPSLGVFLLLSICLVIAFELTGSLLVPMAMHAIFNAVSVSVLIFIPQDMI